MRIVQLGQVDYEATWEEMKEFTRLRNAPNAAEVADVLWLCEHPEVFTQGLAGKEEHLFNPGGIPVVKTDRGGQVTFHGPGQVVAYPLLDLRRAGYFVKEYVYRIEEALIRTLLHFGVTGHRVPGAPGIYVSLLDPRGHARPTSHSNRAANGDLIPDFTGLGKIAALGIKVSRHCAYHGVALNVKMDLGPFAGINPCGYAQLQTIDLSTIGVSATWEDVSAILGQKLVAHLLA
jgi:lipoyl(octanoyl) transferase